MSNEQDPKPELSTKLRRYFAKQAHSLKPVVMIGKAGLTEEVVSATTAALDDHELIKVRFVDHKSEKKSISSQLADRTDSTLIRIIGNIAILFRRNDDPEKQQYRIPEL